MGAAFYRGADCCMLVYDVTDNSSFENLSNWRNEFLMRAAPRDPANFPFIVCGNKCDLTGKRKVTTERAILWCKEKCDIPYIETSAKIDRNIDQAFKILTAKSLARENVYIDDKQNLVALSTEDSKEKKGCSC